MTDDPHTTDPPEVLPDELGPAAESDGVDDRTYDEPEPDPAYVPPLVEDDDGDPA